MLAVIYTIGFFIVIGFAAGGVAKVIERKAKENN